MGATPICSRASASLAVFTVFNVFTVFTTFSLISWMEKKSLELAQAEGSNLGLKHILLLVSNSLRQSKKAILLD